MNHHHLFTAVVATSLVLSGCQNGGTQPPLSEDGVLIVEPIADQSFFLDPLWVTDAWMEGDQLRIQVFYSGGCETHRVQAYVPDFFTGASPYQLAVYLRHDSNNDACEAIVHETLSFDIGPARDLHREIFKGDGLFYFQINTFSSPDDPVVKTLFYSGVFDSPKPDLEAEHMALVLSQDLVAPQGLYDRVREDLRAIRLAYGEEPTAENRPLSGVGFRAPWIPGELIIELGPAEIVQARRGLYTGWNDLNNALGIEEIIVNPDFDYARLVFSVQIHPCLAAQWYLSLPGVKNAGPNGIAGDAPNIFPRMIDGGLSYVFREAWGDCPAGCINSDFWYFQRRNANTDFLGRFNPRVDDPPPSWWEDADQNLWFYNNQGLCSIF